MSLHTSVISKILVNHPEALRNPSLNQSHVNSHQVFWCSVESHFDAEYIYELRAKLRSRSFQISPNPFYKFLTFFFCPFLKPHLQSMWSLAPPLPHSPQPGIRRHPPCPRQKQSTAAALAGGKSFPNSEKWFTASFLLIYLGCLQPCYFSLDITGLESTVARSRQQAEHTLPHPHLAQKSYSLAVAP